MSFTSKVRARDTENEPVQYNEQKRKIRSHSHIKNLKKVRTELIPGVTLPDALYVSISVTGLKAALTKTTRPIIKKLGYPTKLFFSSQTSIISMN